MHQSPRCLLLLPVFLGLLSGCAPPAQVDLDRVYERTDRDFDSAILFRPDDLAEGSAAWKMAPLLIVQDGESGATAPIVTYEETAAGWTYRWWDQDGSHVQGIHASLGADGFPIAYEILHDSSGARLLFVDTTVEQRSAELHGSPLAERRFAVERARDVTPDVAVGGLFEPGPTPLGPFVYLWAETHDVNVLLCRCMPARVVEIVDSVAYRLIPFDPSAAPPGLELPAPLETVLRLAPGNGDRP